MDILYVNIKNRRLELGMSQSVLAEKLGYADKSAIARIEAGQTDLGLEKVKAFAKALNTSAAVLAGLDGTQSTDVEFILSDDEKLMVRRYRKLSSGRKVDIKNQMDMYISLDSAPDASSL